MFDRFVIYFFTSFLLFPSGFRSRLPWWKAVSKVINGFSSLYRYIIYCSLVQYQHNYSQHFYHLWGTLPQPVFTKTNTWNVHNLIYCQKPVKSSKTLNRPLSWMKAGSPGGPVFVRLHWIWIVFLLHIRSVGVKKKKPLFDFLLLDLSVYCYLHIKSSPLTVSQILIIHLNLNKLLLLQFQQTFVKSACFLFAFECFKIKHMIFHLHVLKIVTTYCIKSFNKVFIIKIFLQSASIHFIWCLQFNSFKLFNACLF